MLAQLPLRTAEERSLRVTLGRWAKALHETGETPAD
jgi:hypothetical protein